MLNLSDDKYIIKTKILLGTIFDQENDEDVFIELKEPNGLKFIRLNDSIKDGKSETVIFEQVVNLLPEVIISHNIYKTETELADNQQVIDALLSKTEALTHVVSEYSEKVLFLLVRQKSK